MKFRTRKGKVRLATTSGHVTWLNEEWKELPELFHIEAWSSGCISEDMAAVLQGGGPSFEESRRENIIEAIREMEKADDPSLFTDTGLPNLKKLREYAGFEVTSEERDDAWAEHTAL